MTIYDALNALAGFGIFLFSLRYLTTVLERWVTRRIKEFVSHLLATPVRGFAVGLLFTMGVQASSITVIAAMGLVAASWITFEQGYFVMLGATLGTTIKAWFFALAVDRWGGVLIGLCSIALVVVRRTSFREVLQMLVALGFTFVGLDLMAHGLDPLTRTPGFVGYMQSFDGHSLSSQFMGVLVGVGLTVAIQSSSTMVFLTISLAQQGAITIPCGACLILGANIGTTLTPWVASLDYDANVRRLANAHVLVKTVGVCLTLFFFPEFLQVVELLTRLLPLQPGAQTQLAGVHTFFAIMDVITFGLLSGLMFRMMVRVTPDRREITFGLPDVVRRMLTRSPERALREAEQQLRRLDEVTKALTEYCMQTLLRGTGAAPTDSGSAAASRKRERLSSKTFADVREALSDLLLRLSRNDLRADQRDIVLRQLHFISRCDELHDQATTLLALLHLGLDDFGYALPAMYAPLVAAYQKDFDAIWLRAHFHRSPSPDEVMRLCETIEKLEQTYFEILPSQRQTSQAELTWLYDVVRALRQMGDYLVIMCGVSQQLPTSAEEQTAELLADIPEEPASQAS